MVLDTSVVVLGILAAGPARRLIQDAVRGELRVVTSPALLDELEGVLVQRFTYSIEAASEARQELESLAEVVPGGRLRGDCLALDAARHGAADAIVTRDSDLLGLETWEGIPIVDPETFEAGLAPG